LQHLVLPVPQHGAGDRRKGVRAHSGSNRRAFGMRRDRWDDWRHLDRPSRGPATAVPLLLLRRDGISRAHARPFGLADPRNHGHRAAADWRQRIWLLSYSIRIDLHDVAAE